MQLREEETLRSLLGSLVNKRIAPHNTGAPVRSAGDIICAAAEKVNPAFLTSSNPTAGEADMYRVRRNSLVLRTYRRLTSMGQNSNSMLPLTQPGRVPTQAEFNAIVAKAHKTGSLTPEEMALKKAYTNMRAQQFVEALKEGIRNKVPTP